MPVAVVLAAAYLIASPWSADLAAQTFRADLYADHGFLIWNNLWYSGHYLPGYSVIYPPLGALLGPRLVGALAAVAAAGCFAALARHRYGDRARVAVWWFGAATVTNLITGRITFALGLALGLAALLALQRDRRVLGPVLGMLTALASPVAALFVALAGAAVARGRRRVPGAVVAIAALGTAGVMSLAFPTDGWFPFATTAFLPVPLFALAMLALVPRDESWLRRGIVLYLALAIAVAVVHTPIGANAARLGALFAGPIAALVLIDRPRLLLALAIPLIYWQWVAPIRDFTDALGDPSAHRSFYAPLIAELQRVHPRPVPVEVPATHDRTEAAYLAPEYPIARGWLRQLESDDFDLFTGGNLTPSAYRHWLDDRAIGFVALPKGVDFDYLGGDEAALVRGGLPYLRAVWRNPDWTLYRVAHAQPFAGIEASDYPPDVATMRSVGPADFSLDVRQAGTYLVRLHYTPYWQTSSAGACVEPADHFPGNWTQVVASRAGAVSVSARFSLSALFGEEHQCSA